MSKLSKNRMEFVENTKRTLINFVGKVAQLSPEYLVRVQARYK